MITADFSAMILAIALLGAFAFWLLHRSRVQEAKINELEETIVKIARQTSKWFDEIRDEIPDENES